MKSNYRNAEHRMQNAVALLLSIMRRQITAIFGAVGSFCLVDSLISIFLFAFSVSVSLSLSCGAAAASEISI